MNASNANDTMALADTDFTSPYLDTVAPQARLLQILAIITLLLDFPCLVWHLRNRNLPPILMVGWIMTHNLYSVANSFIWPNDNMSTYWHGVGYCDIMTKLDIAGQFSKVACALCIMRALAKALDTDRPMVNSRSGAELTRERLFEGTLCVFLPILYAIAQFIVSDRRYYITSISGCEYSFDYTWAAFPLVLIWLPLLCYASCYYAILIIIRLHRYKRDFAAVLASTDSGLSRSRFFRLLGLAGVFLLAYLPFTTYTLAYSIQPPYLDFSWSRIHNPSTWQTVLLYESFGQVEIGHWIKLTEGFVVFAVFGFGKDMNAIYSKILTSIGVSQAYRSIGSTFKPRSSSDTTRLRKHPVSCSTTSTLKGRARHILSKLSINSSLSSRGTRDSLGSPASPPGEKLAFPQPSPNHMHAHPLSSPHPTLGPSSPQHRPTGLAEKSLYDDDLAVGLTSPAPTVFSTAATVVVPHNQEVNDTHDAHHFDSLQMGERRSQSNGNTLYESQHSRPTELTTLTRSRFWMWMHNYVAAMGPRNHRPGQAAAVSASASAARERWAGTAVNGPSDLDVLRARDYEAYVVGRSV